MELSTQFAFLLGRYEALIEYAIEGLKGNTELKGADLANYLEKRIKESKEEINFNKYGNRNNSQTNKEGSESNTEAVAG
jgi:hypothetical protein